MNYVEDPFNMGMIYISRYHSKWVCFQIPNTQPGIFQCIRGILSYAIRLNLRAFYIGVAPPGDRSDIVVCFFPQ